MSPLLEYFTKGGPINKDQFLATLTANPGAASDVDPKTGNTPLHFVCCNGAPRDLVEPLLQANPTAAATADLDGFLPLVGALSCGAAADVIDLLLAANPAAASTKVDGRTPLHYAVSHGCDVRVTKALVRLFPDACATRDADGNAPLHFALVRCAAPDVVDVLVRARPGACGQRGFLGRLPLQLAKLYGAAASTLEVLTCVEVNQRVGRTSLSHFSAMARPSWLG
jgi:ankyrin repeat protein